MVFLEYRRGLTEKLTLEAYTQALDTAGLVGINALHALRIGKVKAEVAGSLTTRNRISVGRATGIHLHPQGHQRHFPIQLEAARSEYLGKEFFRPGQDQGLLGSLTYGGYYQKHSSFADLSLGASYTLRFDSVDYYSGYVGVGKRFGKGWSTNFSLRNSFDWSRHTNTTAAATVSYYLFQGDNSINASNRIENHVPDGTEKGAVPNWDNYTDLAWDYNGSAPFPRNPSLAASTSFSPWSNDYTGKATWKGGQGIAGGQCPALRAQDRFGHQQLCGSRVAHLPRLRRRELRVFPSHHQQLSYGQRHRERGGMRHPRQSERDGIRRQEPGMAAGRDSEHQSVFP